MNDEKNLCMELIAIYFISKMYSVAMIFEVKRKVQKQTGFTSTEIKTTENYKTMTIKFRIASGHYQLYLLL